jgi:hypothetical protein
MKEGFIKPSTDPKWKDTLSVSKLELNETIVLKKIFDGPCRRVDKSGQWGDYISCSSTIEFEGKQYYAWFPEIVADEFDKVAQGGCLKIEKKAKETKEGRVQGYYECTVVEGDSTPSSSGPQPHHVTKDNSNFVHELNKSDNSQLQLNMKEKVLVTNLEKEIFSQLSEYDDEDMIKGIRKDISYFKDTMKAYGSIRDDEQYSELHKLFNDFMKLKFNEVV